MHPTNRSNTLSTSQPSILVSLAPTTSTTNTLLIPVTGLDLATNAAVLDKASPLSTGTNLSTDLGDGQTKKDVHAATDYRKTMRNNITRWYNKRPEMRCWEEGKIEQVHEKMTEYYQAWEALKTFDELDQEIESTARYRAKIDAVSLVVSAVLDLTAMEAEVSNDEQEDPVDGDRVITPTRPNVTKKSVDELRSTQSTIATRLNSGHAPNDSRLGHAGAFANFAANYMATVSSQSSTYVPSSNHVTTSVGLGREIASMHLNAFASITTSSNQLNAPIMSSAHVPVSDGLGRDRLSYQNTNFGFGSGYLNSFGWTGAEKPVSNANSYNKSAASRYAFNSPTLFKMAQRTSAFGAVGLQKIGD